MLNKELTPLQGLLAEFLATSILILVVCSVFDKRNAHNTDSVPIKFGLTIAALAMAEVSVATKIFHSFINIGKNSKVKGDL